MRLRRALIDGWLLSPDSDAPAVIAPTELKPPVNGWRPVRVPGHWQTQFRDLARATGPVWYNLTFALDKTWVDRDALNLDFGAVSHFCQGWLNGHYLGEHEGGHMPFSWSLSRAARAGANELFVRVVSPSGDRSKYPDFPFEETLHGKQSWYGPTGGIWQEAAIEARSSSAIDRLHVQPDSDNGQVDVRVDLASDTLPADIRLEVLDPDDVVVARLDNVAPGTAATVALADENLKVWSPESPALYRARATVFVNGLAVDTAQKRFGFRTFVTDRGRFILNGEPILMRGVLDQDYFDGPGVAIGKQQLIDRFAAVKAMGFNTIRCHIKIPDPLYLDAADEVGMLLWCELASTSRLTHRARSRIEETLNAMVDRDRHHPSIVIWSIANESWGYDLVGNAEHRSWLHDIYLQMKATVTDRLIVDNSPCSPNFHIETDIEDYHFYAVIPEMRDRWDRFLEAFADRSGFTFSPHGDAHRTGAEPLVVSEFGTCGSSGPQRPGRQRAVVVRDGPGVGRRRGLRARCSTTVLAVASRQSVRQLGAPVRRDPAPPIRNHAASDRDDAAAPRDRRLCPDRAERCPLGGQRFVRHGGPTPELHRPVGGAQPVARVIAQVDRSAIWENDTTGVELTVINDSEPPNRGSDRLPGPRRDRPVQAHDRSARGGRASASQSIHGFGNMRRDPIPGQPRVLASQ